MGQFKRFEDIPVWRDGRQLVKDVYAATRKSPFCRDAGLGDQIQRAAVSVTSNIAEGFERGTTTDLIRFLFYAKGSAGEVRSQLYNAEDLGDVSASDAERPRERARSISRQIQSWITSMQTPRFRQGPKYHKEKDRGWERFAARSGMVRLPDGRFAAKDSPEARAVSNSGRSEE